MRSILVSGGEDSGAEVRLQAALDLARLFGGHVTVLFDLPITRYVAMDTLGGSYVASEALNQAREDEDRVIAKLEERLGREDVPFDIARSEDEPATALAGAAQLADLVVVSRSSGVAGDVALLGGAPVLALPDDRLLSVPPRRACIGWDGGEQAAAAVRAAIPLLARCESVEVIHVAEKSGGFPATDVLRYLSRHGVEANLTELERRGSAEETLAVAVMNAKPDLLVMGAYGKSRLREFIFGGATAHFLSEANAPALLLAH